MPILGLLEYAALQRLLGADLEARVAALEAQLGGKSPLKERNATRQADAERLRQAIAGVLATHEQPERLTAKHVMRALQPTFGPCPSERTVRLHLAALRGNGNTV